MFKWVHVHVKQQSHCIASNKLRKFTKINIISTHNNKLIRALLFSCNVMYTSIFGITQNEHIYHLMSRVRRNEIDMYINLCVYKITNLYVSAADQRMASAGFFLTGKQHFFERRAAQFLVFTGQLLRH